ncbi:squamosa promoter-binding-like protein 8 isoform X4 [Abrus precatorius]|uniref:Squamosa promoter-binding-like protein 8 isoform X4 n=1 Tax=Abrus precatorius TaxID=3816 RepID=A0A8B8JU40_ABRPR|nr:squamosa promoter-binding-like protein 8 isoform X4 [Abrus precatorius]
MLEYEWGNPSTIMLTGNEDGAAAAADQTHRQIFDHYASHTLLPDHFLHGPTHTTAHTNTVDFTNHHFNPQPHQHLHHHHHPFFDPRAFHGASSTSYPPPQPPPPSVLSLDPLPHVNAATCGPGPGPGLLLVPKSEEVGRPMDFVGSRIGLNLGGRTYFSSSEDDFVSRLYRRSRPAEPGSTASNSPRCQAEGCNADLSQAKHYHRRHKVCSIFFLSLITENAAAGRDWQIIIAAEEKLSSQLKKSRNLSLLWIMLQGPHRTLELSRRRR